jgi:hypothetical protein
MIRFTPSDAHKIVGIATNDPKTARSCKMNESCKSESALMSNSMRTKPYESDKADSAAGSEKRRKADYAMKRPMPAPTAATRDCGMIRTSH